MSAIVTTVLKGTLGFLIKKGQQSASEKLKDGDVTDEQIRKWIVEEFDNVNTKLDDMARIDLGASISFFKEGLVFLSKVMDAVNAGGQICSNAVPVEAGEGKNVKRTNAEITELAARGVEALSLIGEGLKLNKLDEEGKEAISDAKKRFDEARVEATKAFNNKLLTPSDRILAMAVRLTATILEKVENPVSAIAACKSGLEELHLMPFVTENFSIDLQQGFKSKFSKDERRQIICSVCQINRVIYDFIVMVESKDELFFWPCIEIGDEKVDPLRDLRVANTLRKQEMGHLCLAWSFGQEGETEDQTLQSAFSIATNSFGQFLIVDGECVKIFNASGKFVKSFPPIQKTGARETTLLTEETEYGYIISAVGADRDNSIYVLMYDHRNAETYVNEYDQSTQLQHIFNVANNFRGVTLKVTNSSLLLVPGQFSTRGRISNKNTMFSNEDRNYAVVIGNKRKGRLSEKTLGRIRDVTAADDRIMFLDYHDDVFVFTDVSVLEVNHLHSSCQLRFKSSSPTDDDDDDDDDAESYDDKDDSLVSKFLKKFPVRGTACAITFHPRSKHVIIASQTKDDRSQLHFYSKEGKFERSIDLDVEQYYSITGAAVTTEGRICVATNGRRERKGKVLIV